MGYSIQKGIGCMKSYELLRGCLGKRKYAVLEKAQACTDEINRRQEDKVHVYVCQFCNWYHIGHIKRNEAMA